METDIIYTKDCSCMDEVSENTVDLIIAGPPYWEYIGACNKPFLHKVLCNNVCFFIVFAGYIDNYHPKLDFLLYL